MNFKDYIIVYLYACFFFFAVFVVYEFLFVYVPVYLSGVCSTDIFEWDLTKRLIQSFIIVSLGFLLSPLFKCIEEWQPKLLKWLSIFFIATGVIMIVLNSYLSYNCIV